MAPRFRGTVCRVSRAKRKPRSRSGLAQSGAELAVFHKAETAGERANGRGKTAERHQPQAPTDGGPYLFSQQFSARARDVCDVEHTYGENKKSDRTDNDSHFVGTAVAKDHSRADDAEDESDDAIAVGARLAEHAHRCPRPEAADNASRESNTGPDAFRLIERGHSITDVRLLNYFTPRDIGYGDFVMDRCWRAGRGDGHRLPLKG